MPHYFSHFPSLVYHHFFFKHFDKSFSTCSFHIISFVQYSIMFLLLLLENTTIKCCFKIRKAIHWAWSLSARRGMATCQALKKSVVRSKALLFSWDLDTWVSDLSTKLDIYLRTELYLLIFNYLTLLAHYKYLK